MSYTITRRDALRRASIGAGMLALPSFVTACGNDDGGNGGADSARVVFATFGGEYDEAVKQAWFDPFMKANPGIEIVIDPTADETKIPAMVQSGRVTWDILEVNYFGDSLTEKKSITEIDCAVVPCADFPRQDELVLSHRIPDLSYSMVLAYRTDKLDGEPSSWADFFDAERFPGKRGIFKRPVDGTLEIALLADGVAPNALYPLDVERALRKLDTIADDLVFWDGGSQSLQLISDGEVAMQQMYNGRADAAEKAGKPVRTQWNQNIQLYGFLVVPKGAENAGPAMKLMAYIADSANNARISEFIAYGPANPKAVSAVKASDPKALPSAHISTSVPFNFKWWADNQADVEERFQAWLQS